MIFSPTRLKDPVVEESQETIFEQTAEEILQMQIEEHLAEEEAIIEEIKENDRRRVD